MKREGFIAVTSAIIISVALLAIAFTASFMGFFGRFNILEAEFKEQSVALAEACGENALLKLAADPTYSGGETLTVGSSTCAILLIESAAGQKTIKTKAVFQNAVTNIRIIANESDLSVVRWGEVP